MKWLTKHASNIETDNFSGKFRSKRFQILNSRLEKLKLKNVHLIDIGGSNYFWDTLKKSHKINFDLTLVNLNEGQLSGYRGIVADAAKLEFIKDNSFDLCFSNSVIEHLPTIEQQYHMAKSCTRIAPYYFIQTPAFIFPIEPHFLFPFFHWLPKEMRIWLVQKFELGWYRKLPNKQDAKKLVSSIRIIKKGELKKMFPGAEIITEYVLFLPKSYIVTNLN